MRLTSTEFIRIVLHLRLAVLASVASALLLTGCESKVSQCQKVIKIHNQIVMDTKKVSDAATKEDMSSVTKSGEVFAQGAKDMASLEVKDERLLEIKNQFATMYQNASQVIKKIIESQTQKKASEVAKNRANLNQVASPEKDLVDAVNSHCTEGKQAATSSPVSSTSSSPSPSTSPSPSK
jgi:hypothetical protein